MDIYSRNNRTQTVRNIYFFGLFFSECLPSHQWENLSWTQLYFPSSSEMGEGREGKKGNFVRKKNGYGYQKDSAHLLRVLSKFLKAQREGGFSRSSVTPPSLKLNPIEWEMEWCRDCEEQSSDGPEADCMTTNTSLGVLTVGNLREDPKMPSSLFPLPPTVWVQALPAAPCVQLLHLWLESGATESLTRRVLLLLGEWLTEVSTTS